MADVCPVIVGVGRSGTTLLRLMLDAHPELAIPPETHFVTRLEPLAHLSDARAEFFALVTDFNRWLDFGLSKSGLELALAELGDTSASGCLRCFYQVYAARFGKPRWGEKTPIYLRSMYGIQKLLPEAGFIHVIRDGRDVALSSRELWFGPGREIEKQAAWWVQMIGEARAQARVLPRYMEIYYETLVASPEAELRRICGALDLEYCAEMLDYPVTAGERIGAFKDVRREDGRLFASGELRQQIHAKALDPPDPTRVGRWRADMTEDEQRRYEAIAGPLLRELGFETRF